MTRSERVYSRLREDILSVRYAPGERLRFSALCQNYQTSVGVVREGLSRLAEQGLVETSPRQGFRVADVSAERLIELSEARIAIESLALRSAIQHGDLEWESQVVGAFHILARTKIYTNEGGHKGFTVAWVGADTEFHFALIGACTNLRIRKIAQELREAAAIYVHWSTRFGVGEKRDVAAEHQELLAAVLERDEDRAAASLRHHIETTTDALLLALDTSGHSP